MRGAWQRLGHIAFWLSWPALSIYLRIGARTRVCIIADHQILLVKGWLSPGSWMLPGGGLHRGEDVRVGAVREVAEETGLRLDPAGLHLLGSEWWTNRGLKSYLHFFAAELEQPIAPQRQKGEIVDARWFRLDALPEAELLPEVRRVLELSRDH